MLLCAVLVACYGILSVAATGPHAHDLRSAATRDRESPPSAAVEAPASEGSSGQKGRLVHCRLCAWSRSTARPAFAASMSEVEPRPLALRPIPEDSRAENRLAATALLRAPPEA